MHEIEDAGQPALTLFRDFQDAMWLLPEEDQRTDKRDEQRFVGFVKRCVDEDGRRIRWGHRPHLAMVRVLEDIRFTEADVRCGSRLAEEHDCKGGL